MLAFAINCVNTLGVGCLSVCAAIPYQYNYYPITDLLYCVLLHYLGKGQYPHRRYYNADKTAHRTKNLKFHDVRRNSSQQSVLICPIKSPS